MSFEYIAVKIAPRGNKKEGERHKEKARQGMQKKTETVRRKEEGDVAALSACRFALFKIRFMGVLVLLPSASHWKL